MTDTESQLDIIEKGPLSDEAAVEPEEQAATETVEEPVEEVEAPEDQEEDSAEESEDDSEEEAPKPKRRRNRTAKLAAKLTNAEQQIAALQQQLHGLQPPPAEVQPPPRQEDFTNYEEFARADARYVAREEARKEMQELNAKVAEATQQFETQHRQTEWNKQEAKAREKYDDYDEVVRDEDLPITPTMAAALQQMEDGADVAYHLGTHPDESARIAQLTDVGQVTELGRIASKRTRPKPKQTTTPNPVKTVKSGSAPQALTPENARNMDDFVKARRAQSGQT